LIGAVAATPTAFDVRRAIACVRLGAYGAQVSSVTEALAEAVLVGLVNRDPRVMIDLVFDEPSGIADTTGRQVDDVLLEAHHRGLLHGDRGEGDGSVAWWSSVSLTVAGLQSLGQWPPSDREWARGLWDEGYWGARARPLLAELRDNPPAHGYYFREGLGDADPEPARRWASVLLLIEAGLVLGEVQTEGVANLRITGQGGRALDPVPDDPLDVAVAQLRGGSPVDAIVTAVEGVLVGRLREIAAARGVSTTYPDGGALPLSRLNSDLRQAAAYGEADRAQVDAWYKVRNQLAHADGDPVSSARILDVICGIRTFLDDHSA
jgi:hypothetical protein